MNQIPNIEETHNTREIEEIFREYEWLAESTGNPTMHIGGERLQNLKNDIKAHIHQQLQKAREERVDFEAIKWGYMKLLGFGLQNTTAENALMMDRLRDFYQE